MYVAGFSVIGRKLKKTHKILSKNFSFFLGPLAFSIFGHLVLNSAKISKITGNKKYI